MASSVIHMCVAKKINEQLKYDENMLLLGSIAPDISKHLGETKVKSHFFTDGENIDIERFLNKYKDKIKNPFIMGYFIHLYTDLLWEKYFVSEIIEKNSIILLNGDKVENTEETYHKLIYNDYTNLNVILLDEYNLDLSLFYNEVTIPNITMDEIPIDKLSVIVDQTGIIIKNTKENKAYTFKLDNIKPFINTSSNLIYSKIKEII